MRTHFLPLGSLHLLLFCLLGVSSFFLLFSSSNKVDPVLSLGHSVASPFLSGIQLSSVQERPSVLHVWPLFSLQELSGFLAPCLVFPFGSASGLTTVCNPAPLLASPVSLLLAVRLPHSRFLGHICCPSPVKSSFKISLYRPLSCFSFFLVRSIFIELEEYVLFCFYCTAHLVRSWFSNQGPNLGLGQ